MSAAARIRLAGPEDSAAIAWMLQQLAHELGDGAVFASTEDTIRRHGFGAEASFAAMLAETDGTPQGLALFFRHFSTTRGLAGVYVQDLWIAPERRGERLGKNLLAMVADHAARTWDAAYLALTVYRDNSDAARFYDRLGFDTHHNDAPMSLAGSAFRELAQTAGVAA